MAYSYSSTSLSLLPTIFLLQLFFKMPAAIEEEIAPVPADLKVVIRPALLNATWDCNITEEMQKYQYYVSVCDSLQELELLTCFHEIRNKHCVLHNGVQVDILSRRETFVKNTWSQKTVFPEGKMGASAENISCLAYNVSYMNCSWDVGKEAPTDTKYSFYLLNKTGGLVEKCKEYSMDAFGRQTMCFLKDLKIKLFNTFYMYVTGSSIKIQIPFSDRWIIPAQYEILNPPRNITLESSMNELTITWEIPITDHSYPQHCFIYEIHISDKTNDSHDYVNKNTYKISHLNLNKQYILKIRANRVESCHESSMWGKWSEPLKFGNTASFIHNYLWITLVCIATALLIALCYRFKIMKKIFPRIPQPKNKLIDLPVHEEKYMLETKCCGSEAPLMQQDNEEFFLLCKPEMSECGS